MLCRSQPAVACSSDATVIFTAGEGPRCEPGSSIPDRDGFRRTPNAPGAPPPFQCRVRLLSLRPDENGRSPESERLLRYESWHVHVGRCNRCRKLEGALDHLEGGFDARRVDFT